MHTCHSHTRHMCKYTSLSLSHRHIHLNSAAVEYASVSKKKPKKKPTTKQTLSFLVFCFHKKVGNNRHSPARKKQQLIYNKVNDMHLKLLMHKHTHTRLLRFQSAHTQNNNIIIKTHTHTPPQSIMHNKSACAPAPLQPSMHNQSIYTHTRMHAHTHKQHTSTYTPTQTHTDSR